MPAWRIVRAASAAAAAFARLGRRLPAGSVGSPRAPSPPADSAAPRGPTIAGRYRLVGELGRGGSGTVHLAEDLRDGGRVAIKTLDLPPGLDPVEAAEAGARFLREAEAARRLRHPGIVDIRDAGEADGLRFIAMEVLGGADLGDPARATPPLPVATVLRIVARVALALDHAHRLGVVHRDVKPGNIVWDAATDTVKVTDFGIASVADAERTRTGVLLGTPRYMSPEQLAGARVDGRSDLFSLGVVLYELLTGALPYADGTAAALMRQIAVTPAPDIRQRRPALPEVLADVVALALQKQPALRYADGAAFAADLLTVAGRIDAEMRPDGT